MTNTTARHVYWISVEPELGKLLTLLDKISGARRILEIGALGGYSAICLARGLADDGKIVSLELQQQYADLALTNMRRAGLADRVEYRIGPALDRLQELFDEGERFDFFLIDADKDNYPLYLEWALQLANPGAIITADNVLWKDRVLDPENRDKETEAVREFNRRLAADERLEALLLPICDGFAIARVK
ncbi:O-methyltransferase [Effusibacillus pohliae]|uniref:O-methyltransferase n=1 Tax=Effusibacillus pohliae TaxID=232270 RepID=UPI00037260C8|nr:O-methyltransferase [Effusibacillus pohliae]